MSIPASVSHALDGGMLPTALRVWRQLTRTALMKTQYVVIELRCYPSQETAVLGTGSSIRDHGSFCSTVARSSWSSMPYFDSSMEQPGGVGALLERCCSFLK
jgi:hypothetical protein